MMFGPNTNCLTQHAVKRMQQRGRRETDIAAIIAYGTRTQDGYLLRRRDADLAIQHLKQQIGRIERLKGWAAIAGDDDVILTVYPTTRPKQRRMLKR